jgi:hypothetical protein
MPANPTWPQIGSPLSERELKRFKQRDAEYEFLRYLTTDRRHFFEDFGSPVADGFVAETNIGHLIYTTPGATTTGFAHVAHADGVIRGVSGTTAATSGLKIATPVEYYGDQMCGMEVRYRTSVITEERIEMGFASTSPSINTKYVNSMATPTFNTTANAALDLYDHATATTTSGLYTIGTAITAAKTATTTNRPVADTWQTIRIQVVTNHVYVWVDGIPLVKHNTSGTNYIEGGTAAAWVFSVVRSDTTDANQELDYVRTWQNRL